MINSMTKRQYDLLRRRGLNPKDYVVVRDLFSSTWYRNIHTGTIKIINKNN